MFSTKSTRKITVNSETCYVTAKVSFDEVELVLRYLHMYDMKGGLTNCDELKAKFIFRLLCRKHLAEWRQLNECVPEPF